MCYNIYNKKGVIELDIQWLVLTYQVQRIDFSGSFIVNNFPENFMTMKVEEIREWAKKEVVNSHNWIYETLITENDITFIDVSIKFGEWSMTVKPGGIKK